MEKYFVPYTEALALEELGFNEPFQIGNKTTYYEVRKNETDVRSIFCNDGWKNLFDDSTYVLRPLYSQAFRFFRDKGYENWIPHNDEGYQFVIKWEFEHTGGIEALRKINSYEEAQLECLKTLIEIVKKT